MTSPFSLAGRVALVTGASQGLGAAMAAALAEAGAHVVLVARTRDKLEARAEEIGKAGGEASVVPLDLTDDRAVVEAVAQVAAERGRLDVLVNNAGIIDRALVAESGTEGFRQVLETNVTAAYVMARECAVPMVAHGWGRIVNIGSILSVIARPSVVSYTASKHAIVGLTKTLAAEFGASGVHANAILPGYFRTEINVVLQQNTEFNAMVESRTPLGRWGETPDLVGPLLLLASDGASYVNGHALTVDGGFTATI